MKRLIQIFGISLSLLFLASTALSAQASGNLQTFITPTPGPDGRILITVSEGQNCSIIANIAGIPLSQLRSLNRLDDACTLSIGQQLLIGMGGPVGGTPTPSGPAITATPAQPSPTPNQGEASVCVLLYDDLNGDALRQDTETAIPGGAVSVTGTSGQYSQTATTIAGIDPVCFAKVVQGTYNISVAAPQGYNPTTQQNFTLDIKNGEQIFVDFGAQLGGQATPQDPTSEPGTNSLLGIAGGILIIAALGLGIYGWLAFGQKTKSGFK